MWYVIQVMTGKEDAIAGNLKEQGIKALVPKENRLIRSGGSWTRREYILFTGYVFLDMKYDAENYYKVKNLPGVIKFLGDSKNPSRLSYLEAEWIMLLTGKDNTPIEPTTVDSEDKAKALEAKGFVRTDGKTVPVVSSAEEVKELKEQLVKAGEALKTADARRGELEKELTDVKGRNSGRKK